MDPSPWIGATADSVGAIVAIAGAGVVFVEYRSNRRAARLEQAAEVEQRYDNDPLIRFAWNSLDWGTGLLPVPAEYQEFVGQASLKHDLALLHAALRPSLQREIESNPAALLYRQAFVSLFNHLEKVLSLWRRGSLQREDLSNTRWVTGELADWAYAKHGGKPAPEWFRPALRTWNPNVIKGASLEDLVVAFAIASGARRREDLVTAAHPFGPSAGLARSDEPERTAVTP